MINIRSSQEDGYTIVEMMVVVLLLSLLSTVFYAFLFGGERASRDGRQWVEANQNARLAMERMQRELREADQIVSVSSPDGKSSITFQSDLDQDGTFVTGTYVANIEPSEVLTYRWLGEELLISTAVTPTVEAVLSRHIKSFSFSYFGSEPKLDGGCSGFQGTIPPDCAANDGLIHWQEIDRSFGYTPKIIGFGDDNGVLDAELDHVTKIGIEMTVGIRNQEHSYRAAVELRNLFK